MNFVEVVANSPEHYFSGTGETKPPGRLRYSFYIVKAAAIPKGRILFLNSYFCSQRRGL